VIATPQPGFIVSPEEYLRLEREAEERHEYDNGRIYVMPGEGINHNRIYINIVGEISAQLKGRTCEAFSSNMKVYVAAAEKFYYPDLSVICGKPSFHDAQKDALLNPKVIIEVLSPSTEKRDRSVKFQAYQQIESLTDYLLVSQDKPLVEHFARQDSGQWLYTAYKDLMSIIQLSIIDCQLLVVSCQL